MTLILGPMGDFLAIWFRSDASANQMDDPKSMRALTLCFLSVMTFKCGLLGPWIHELAL